MLFPKIATGLDLIDNLWQGFFRGRTYLVTGPCNSGKTTFCLQFAVKGLVQKEKVVFFSNERPEDVLLRAEGLQLDIEEALANNQFLIFNLKADISTISDEMLIKTISEISEIVEREKPARLIFDSIVPLLQFDNFEILKSKLSEAIYNWERIKTTSIITLGEPANSQAQQIFDFLNSIATGIIRLAQDLTNNLRTLSLQARLGHYPDFYAGCVKIEPRAGLSQVSVPEPEYRETPLKPTLTPSLVETSPTEIPVKEKETMVDTQQICESVPGEELILSKKETPSPIEGKTIPEYPVRDLDRDDFTGLYNFDGLMQIINDAFEREKSFSLILVGIVSGVDSRAKRLLLSHKLARAVKTTIHQPVPVGRYSDKIIVFLNRTTKSAAQTLASDIKDKVLANLLRENNSFKTIDIRMDVYAYPEDIRATQDFEAIVGTRVEQ